MFARIFALTWIAYCGYYLCRKNFSVLMPYLKTEQRMVVMGGALVSAGCSTLTGTGFPLVVSQGVNGVAQASGWPGVLKLAREWFPAANLGVVMAWWGTHLVMGGFLATNLAASLSAGGWRRGAWVPSILLGLIGLAFGILVRDRGDLVAPRASEVASVMRGPVPLTRPLPASPRCTSA